MFDTIAVQRIAFDKKFFELVIFIEDEREKYVDLILHGDKSNI
jgi:hypothetical protein